MKDVYSAIMFIHWAVALAIWVAILAQVAACHWRAFVNDEEFKWPEWASVRHGRESEDGLAAIFYGWFAGMAVGLLWPLAWAAALYFGPLYMVRTLVRARKAFEAHTHGEDGKVA